MPNLKRQVVGVVLTLVAAVSFATHSAPDAEAATYSKRTVCTLKKLWNWYPYYDCRTYLVPNDPVWT